MHRMVGLLRRYMKMAVYFCLLAAGLVLVFIGVAEKHQARLDTLGDSARLFGEPAFADVSVPPVDGDGDDGDDDDGT